MASEIQQVAEFPDLVEARRYAEEHKKWAKLMYRGILKDVKALGISGRCLEMSAGPAILATLIARMNPDISITAIDISPGMAEVAEETITEARFQDRIRYAVGDVADEKMFQKLGKFNLVYSTYSLHDWEAPEESIRNLWEAVADGGILYIHDFKRIGWICSLPFKGGDMKPIRAALTTDEARNIFQKVGIADFRIKTVFPYIFQSIIARK